MKTTSLAELISEVNAVHCRQIQQNIDYCSYGHTFLQASQI